MNQRFTTWKEVLQHHAENRGDALAFVFLQDGQRIQSQCSFRELARRAAGIAQALSARNWDGQRALMLYPSGIEFVTAFLGCLMSGTVAVPAPPPEPNRQKRSGPRLASIIDDCQASVVLTTSEILNDVRMALDESTSAVSLFETSSVTADSEWNTANQPASDDGIAYLQYTSGSTSAPKGIEITRDNLMHQCGVLQRSCGYDAESVTVTWMPNFHDWGLVEGIMTPILNGTPCYLMSPFSFVRRPRHWLEAISRFRGSHSQGPNFAYEYCVRRIQDHELAGLDLSQWKVADIAAEPIQFAVMQQFYERFKQCGFRWNAFCPSFGLAEATLKVSHCGWDHAPRAMRLVPAELERGHIVEALPDAMSRTIVSCGRPCVDMDVAIVDPATQTALPERTVGEVWVHGPSMARGYWGRTADSLETFRAKLATALDSGVDPLNPLANEPRDFMRTGDLGFMCHGELYISGRLKDLIIIRGRNHYPQDIEYTSQSSHPALYGQTASAFALEWSDGERLVVLQELDAKQLRGGDAASLLQRIVERIVDEHEIDVFDLVLVPRGSIPKTASGKVQRRASRATYQQSELKVLASWRSLRATAAGQHDAECGRTGRSEESAESVLVNEILDWLRGYARRRINSQLMDSRRSVPPPIILDFGNRGLFGLQVPRAYGGLELSTCSTLRILRQLAAIDVSLATLVFLSNTNGLRPILDFASSSLRDQVLPGLAAGRHLAAFALSEPVAGANIGAIKTIAHGDHRGGWRITGTKRWNGSAWAHFITIFARDRDPDGVTRGISAFLIDQDMDGVRLGPESLTMGLRGIVQNSLLLEEVPIGPERLLGTRGQGLEIAQRTLNVGRLGAAAVCLGGVMRTLQLLLTYADRRSISTGPLIEHPQAIAEISQLTSELQMIQRGLLQVGELADRSEIPDWQTMVLKIAASDLFNRTTSVAMQWMGGRGYMENNEIPRLFRDARSLSIGEGPNESLLGFLGQPATLNRIETWLTITNQPQLQAALRSQVSELHLKCLAQRELRPHQREQWSHYLSGTCAVPIVLQAFNVETRRSNDSDVNCRTQRYSAQAFNHAQHLAETMLPSQDSLKESVEKYQFDIGLIVQELPGEDIDSDPMIAMNRESNPSEPDRGAVDSASAERSPMQPSGESRQRLADILKNRIKNAKGNVP